MPDHKLLADEHISKTVVKRLEAYGIDVVHIQDLDMKGVGDMKLVEYAQEHDRSILTRDDDFRKLSEENQVGVILQTKRQSKKRTASDVIKVLNSISVDQLKNEIVYIPWR
ncbi:MAG: DUF5615 family PIN-like protein [Candidatus Nanohaloarchaea archaeon]